MRTAESGTSRRPRREVVRTDVLAAATELFLAQGYQATTLDQVAERAGFTKGAVYSNFGGKPELLAQVCRARFDEVGAGLVRRLSAEGGQDRSGLAGRLAAGLMPTVVGGEGEVLLAELRGLARHDRRLARAYDEVVRHRQAALARQLGRGPFAGTDEAWRLTVAGLLLAQVGVLSLELRARADLLTEQEAQRSLAVLFEGILP